MSGSFHGPGTLPAGIQLVSHQNLSGNFGEENTFLWRESNHNTTFYVPQPVNCTDYAILRVTEESTRLTTVVGDGDRIVTAQVYFVSLKKDRKEANKKCNTKIRTEVILAGWGNNKLQMTALATALLAKASALISLKVSFTLRK